MSEATEIRPLKLIQISDCHLGATPGSRLLGMDTDRSLDAVVDQLCREHSRIDLLVVSGDLAADGAEAAYRRLQSKLSGIGAAMVWLPGNHDDVDLMRNTVGEALMPFALRLAGWQILFFDSQVPGEVGGCLQESQLQTLVRQRDPARPGLIFMHHHLVPLGCDWLDAQRVANAERFFTELQALGGARAVVSGHVHQDWEGARDGQRLLTTPSTCIQFAPGSRRFALDDRSPGYRWFELHADGRLETGVSRVQGVSFPYDHSARGY